ncbi:hypothetical protein CP10139811_0248B, partial [Chlamydia ibidis]
CSCW